MALTFSGFFSHFGAVLYCCHSTAAPHSTVHLFAVFNENDSTVATALAVHPLFGFQRRVCRNKLLEKLETACVMEK